MRSCCAQRDSRNHRGVWQLGAYLQNATDFEHDAAWLLKIELIGVEFTSVEYGQTHFQAYIKGDDEDDFRIGNADYNPLVHPKRRAARAPRKNTAGARSPT